MGEDMGEELPYVLLLSLLGTPYEHPVDVHAVSIHLESFNYAPRLPFLLLLPT